MIKNWVRVKCDNAEAQAAIIYLYVVGLVMGIAVYIYESPIMDAFSAFHVGATQGANPLFPVSQNLEDSIFLTQIAYHDWIFIYFIILTVSCYAAALKYRSTTL